MCSRASSNEQWTKVKKKIDRAAECNAIESICIWHYAQTVDEWVKENERERKRRGRGKLENSMKINREVMNNKWMLCVTITMSLKEQMNSECE